MSFKPQYASVRVSGIGKVTKVSVLCKDGIIYEEDVIQAAREAFASFGGLSKRPKPKKKVSKKAASK